MNRFVRSCFVSAFSAVILLAGVDRGIELYNQNKYTEAQAELAEAVQSNPDDARAHRYLGLALVEQHKPEEAEAHLNRANELEPSGESKLALARMYIEHKELARTEAMLSESEGEDMDYVRGLLHVHREENEEAIDSLERYLEVNPNRAYAHYYVALAYNAARRPDKMLTHFELFLKLKPDAPEARKVRSVLSTGR